ncbi:hypothetical protein KDA14_00480, partial [Candidatus Saccharibacteria bacterium]|nr:hypothetical protein [Candidatus Saccharibacteria bacterium]
MNSAVAEKAGLEERVKLAEHIADEIETRIIRSFHHELKVAAKGKHDFATELDKANETFAQNLVHESFSGDYFFGEEFGGSGTEGSTYEWIVDPLDGTNNFVRGLPLAGFQLAIVNNGEIVHSVVRRPFTQERYH